MTTLNRGGRATANPTSKPAADPVLNVAGRGRTLNGATLGVPDDEPKIEETAKVYLLWDDGDGRWVVDDVTLQDCPLDGLETGPYLNGGDPDDPTTREAYNRACLADLPDARGLLVMLAEALGYRAEVAARKDG